MPYTSATKVKSEDAPVYNVQPHDTDNETIAAALAILRRRMNADRVSLSSPRTVADYLKFALADYDHEVFVVVLLDAQHRVIIVVELFQGTLTQTSVYPREVVKCALRHNAAAVILAHNHPSGVAEPSQADQLLTRTLRSALALVDIQVLDHFVVAGANHASLAERGLL
jgi:DNA repair protein RadC